jgi:hypothetical protein
MTRSDSAAPFCDRRDLDVDAKNTRKNIFQTVDISTHLIRLDAHRWNRATASFSFLK